MGKSASKQAKPARAATAGSDVTPAPTDKPIDETTKRALKQLSVDEALRFTESTELDLTEVQNLHEYFQQLEALDGSSYDDGVSKEVFLVHCLQIERSAAEAAGRLFDVFDLDGSGRISFPELALFTSLLAKGTVEEKLRYAFKAYDRNGDNALDRAEIRLMLQSSLRLAETLCILNRDEAAQISAPAAASEAIANEHVSAIFAECDADHDGTISLDEFLRFGPSNIYIKRVLSFFYAIAHPQLVVERRKLRKIAREQKAVERAAAAGATADAASTAGSSGSATAAPAAPAEPARAAAKAEAASGSDSGSGSSRWSYSTLSSSDH